MNWNDMQQKFEGLVEPLLKAQTMPLFGLLREFGGGRSLAEISAMLAACDGCLR
jgi:hypothetical protein